MKVCKAPEGQQPTLNLFAPWSAHVSEVGAARAHLRSVKIHRHNVCHTSQRSLRNRGEIALTIRAGCLEHIRNQSRTYRRSRLHQCQTKDLSGMQIVMYLVLLVLTGVGEIGTGNMSKSDRHRYGAPGLT